MLLADGRVGPVEVGLLGGEEVEIPVAVGQPGPHRFGGARELGRPVVGREFTVFAAAGAEVEELALRSARQGRPEPRVLVGDMVRDDVDQGADAQFPGLGDQFLRLGECPEGRVDGAVVGDVVAAVGQR